MPGAGRRGLAAMDSWLAGDQHKVPEKSLAAGWGITSTLKLQVNSMINSADAVKVKYKETARGGLAVNIIEC
ncbi:hypothetical protein ACIBCM_26535 [Streptomyces sp. NPDC051018]|uniref:hypothetical protein n=1 Tax=Streptomyces sp. NPDC051018 TaxID=3365639 RepID=UPI0037ABA12C